MFTHIFCISLLTVIIHRFVLYPLFFSPLSHIPNAHFLSPLTSLWIDFKRFTGQEIQAVDKAFRDKGPIVRFGPNELSVNSVDAIRTVHGGGFEKTNWYDFYMNHGTRNSFSIYGKEEHATRRRRFSTIYSKSFIQKSPHVKQIIHTLLAERYFHAICESVDEQAGLNVLDLNLSYGIDFVSAFIFGLSRSTNFIQNHEARDEWFAIYLKSHPLDYMYWLLEFPNFTRWLQKVGVHIVPKWYQKAQLDLDIWALQVLDATEDAILYQPATEMVVGDSPIVYNQLRSSMVEENKESAQGGRPTPQQRLELASECLDHIHATRDTFGITATYMLHQIAIHPKIQRELQEELRSIPTPFSCLPHCSEIPSPTALESLPLLDAVIKESLRLRSTYPTSNPRLTPSNRTTELGPFKNIPPGVRINSFAWSMHHNEAVYKDSHVWHPERWFEGADGREEQERWFWTFGSGRTMCIGRSLAMEMLRYLAALILTNFKFSVLDDAGFGSNGTFVTGGYENSLLLKFERIEQ